MKKSFKAALTTVCFIAAGAFFIGCSSPSGSGDGFTPKYTVGDIVLNDGTKVAYSVAKDYSGDDLANLKNKAIAVIFKADTESKPALGVGIKQNTSVLQWCKNISLKGYNINFTDTVCEPDEGTEAPNLTFKNSQNTDGSKNLAKIIKQLDNENDTGVTCNADGTINFSASSNQTLFKTYYPAFEYAYYYGMNESHNITSGSAFKNGWYLPSLSELNDIYQANKTDSIIEEALGVTGGDKFSASPYWSSSQYAPSYFMANIFKFQNGAVDYNNKNYNGNYVCAIRAFN